MAPSEDMDIEEYVISSEDEEICAYPDEDDNDFDDQDLVDGRKQAAHRRRRAPRVGTLLDLEAQGSDDEDDEDDDDFGVDVLSDFETDDENEEDDEDMHRLMDQMDEEEELKKIKREVEAKYGPSGKKNKAKGAESSSNAAANKAPASQKKKGPEAKPKPRGRPANAPGETEAAKAPKGTPAPKVKADLEKKTPGRRPAAVASTPQKAARPEKPQDNVAASPAASKSRKRLFDDTTGADAPAEIATETPIDVSEAPDAGTKAVKKPRSKEARAPQSPKKKRRVEETTKGADEPSTPAPYPPTDFGPIPTKGDSISVCSEGSSAVSPGFTVFCHPHKCVYSVPDNVKTLKDLRWPKDAVLEDLSIVWKNDDNNTQLHGIIFLIKNKFPSVDADYILLSSEQSPKGREIVMRRERDPALVRWVRKASEDSLFVDGSSIMSVALFRRLRCAGNKSLNGTLSSGAEKQGSALSHGIRDTKSGAATRPLEKAGAKQVLKGPGTKSTHARTGAQGTAITKAIMAMKPSETASASADDALCASNANGSKPGAGNTSGTPNSKSSKARPVDGRGARAGSKEKHKQDKTQREEPSDHKTQPTDDAPGSKSDALEPTGTGAKDADRGGKDKDNCAQANEAVAVKPAPAQEASLAAKVAKGSAEAPEPTVAARAVADIAQASGGMSLVQALDMLRALQTVLPGTTPVKVTLG